MRVWCSGSGGTRSIRPQTIPITLFEAELVSVPRSTHFVFVINNFTKLLFLFIPPMPFDVIYLLLYLQPVNRQ